MPPKAMVVDDSSFQRTVVSEAIGDYVEIGQRPHPTSLGLATSFVEGGACQ